MCTQAMEALLAPYGPPFPPLTVRGRYERRMRWYRRRNEPWAVVMHRVLVALHVNERKLPKFPFTVF